MSASPSDPADYALNHWRQYESQEDHALRVAAAEETAGRYFASTVAKPLQTYNNTMAFLAPLSGPAWDRRRTAARAAWDRSTAAARDLFNITADEIMRDGEVSEETSLAWDVLTEQAEQDYQQPAPSALRRALLQVVA